MCFVVRSEVQLQFSYVNCGTDFVTISLRCQISVSSENSTWQNSGLCLQLFLRQDLGGLKIRNPPPSASQIALITHIGCHKWLCPVIF